MNYWKVAHSWDYSERGGHYDRDVRIGVIYAEAFGSDRSDVEVQQAALYAAMRGARFVRAGGDAPASARVAARGLALTYASHAGSAAQPSIPVQDDGSIAAFGHLLNQEKSRRLLFLPASELLAVRDWDDLLATLGRRRGDPDANDADRTAGEALLPARVGTFRVVPLREDGGRRRALLDESVATLFGTTARSAAAGAKAPDAAELQKALVDFVGRESAKGKPEDALAPQLVATLETWKPAAVRRQQRRQQGQRRQRARPARRRRKRRP